MARPTLIYVINTLDVGGAELGFTFLYENGLASAYKVLLVALGRGSGRLAPILGRLTARYVCLSDCVRITPSGAMRLFWPLLRILQRERPDVVVMSLGYRPPAPETILPNVDGPTYAVDGLRLAHQLNPRQTLT